jgi:hypothetical protein
LADFLLSTCDGIKEESEIKLFTLNRSHKESVQLFNQLKIIDEKDWLKEVNFEMKGAYLPGFIQLKPYIYCFIILIPDRILSIYVTFIVSHIH